MTKSELEVKISTLQNLVTQKNEELMQYAAQIKTFDKELKDISKPKLTMAQVDELTELIEEGIEEFDFDDLDNYSIDYGIDYDNRVTCNSFCFDNVDELTRAICDKAFRMFADAKDEDTNEENQD